MHSYRAAVQILRVQLAVIALGLSTVAGQVDTRRPAGRIQPEQSSKSEAVLSSGSKTRIRAAAASVGMVWVSNSGEGGGPRPRGSAVVVRSDGIVATCYHVIRDSRSDRIYDEILFSLPRDGVVKSPSSGGFRLTTLMVNKQQDLALLRASSLSSAGDWLRPLVLPAVEVDDSTSVQLLDDIYIIGFPEKGGLTVTVNRGTVEGVDALGNWIKTDGRLMRGNSGGAAVDSQGKLIGVPTKVIADSQPIDKDGDGFPEDVRVLGAVGFLRPSKLVAAMVNQLSTTRTAAAPPRIIEPTAEFNVRGIVKSAQDGRPVAGALVGLLPAGATVINETTLLAWGTANPEGVFVLNKPVPAGQYRVKVKAISYDTYQRDIEIDSGTRLVIELSPSGSGGYLLNGAGELSIHLPDPKPAERSLRIPTTGLFTAVSDEV